MCALVKTLRKQWFNWNHMRTAPFVTWFMSADQKAETNANMVALLSRLPATDCLKVSLDLCFHTLIDAELMCQQCSECSLTRVMSMLSAIVHFKCHKIQGFMLLICCILPAVRCHYYLLYYYQG